jgi:type II secretory pathway pseudopilin PulG
VRAQPARDSAGFTLVELLVASMLLVLVLLVVGGIMFSSSKTEVLVRSTTTATSSGQSVTNSIETGVRNAELPAGGTAPIGLRTPTGADQMVTVLTVGSGAVATARCAAWYYSASTGSIRYTTSATAIAAPSSNSLKTWTLLATGISPLSGSAVFSLRGSSALTFAFKVDAGSDPAVPFQSSITSRTGTTGSVACF